MKKFRSRLDSLYRLREQEEQLARTRFATCRQQQLHLENQITNIEHQLTVASAEANALMTKQPEAEILNGTLTLFRQHQHQLQHTQTQYEQASQTAKEALVAWHAVRAELKAISNRIDRQRADHRRSQFLQEEHTQQETAARSFFRNADEVSEGIQS
jgi:flagellar export protein FliJ